jgi:hypothetical protein
MGRRATMCEFVIPRLAKNLNSLDSRCTAYAFGTLPNARTARKWRVPLWLKVRKTQKCEQMTSGLPSKADIARCGGHVSKVP